MQKMGRQGLSALSRASFFGNWGLADGFEVGAGLGVEAQRPSWGFTRGTDGMGR